jgi:colicin import membrane protein
VFSILKTNPLAAAIAIGMHLAILLLMIFGLDWWEKPEAKRFKADVVQATVIDAAKVDAEVKKLKLADENKKKKEKQAKLKEKKRLDDLKKKRQQEEKRLADIKKKRKAEEAKKLKLEKERKRKEAEAKKRAAEEKKKKAAEAKRKAAEEKKRKAAAEKKRKAEEAKKRKQKEREARLRAEMEAERDATEIELYSARIQEAIEMEWLRPMGVGDGLSCTLRIRMAAGGSVIAAQVVRGSGSSAFDRSAEAAVRKADPLPVPSGRLFEKMRTIDLEFAPSGE